MFQLLGVGKRWNMIAVNISLTDTIPNNTSAPKDNSDNISTANNTTNSSGNSTSANNNAAEVNKKIKIGIEDGDKGSFGVRILESKTAISEVRENILFGRGLGYKYCYCYAIL